MIPHPSLEFIGVYETAADARKAGASVEVSAGAGIFAWRTRPGMPSLTMAEIMELADDFREPEHPGG